MSRWHDDYDGDGMPAELWEWNLSRALAGKRGRKALADLREALMALPEHRLISGALCTAGQARRDALPVTPAYLRGEFDDRIEKDGGEGVCSVGAYAWYRKVKAGMDPAEAFDSLPTLQDYDNDIIETALVGKAAGLTYTLAYDLAYRNDETFAGKTPEERWQAFIDWIDGQLAVSASA